MSTLAFERKLEAFKRLGPGGMKCVCCGPSPKYRKKWARNGKKRARRFWGKHIVEFLTLREPTS